MKLTTGILTSILLTTIAGLCFFIFNGKTSRASDDQNEAREFVERLDELGYFNYAAHEDLDLLKKNMIDNFDPNNEVTSIWDDRTGTPKDYRYYFCDGETVYEDGGILTLLNTLKPTFDKIRFKCQITNHFEEWDDKNKWLNHRITLNGTEYIIFKDFTEKGWGEAPKRIAEILNTELLKQGINEQIYLVSGGNDGRLIFLTNELYGYIYSIYQNPNWKPLELDEWAEVMSVKPMKLE